MKQLQRVLGSIIYILQPTFSPRPCPKARVDADIFLIDHPGHLGLQLFNNIGHVLENVLFQCSVPPPLATSSRLMTLDVRHLHLDTWVITLRPGLLPVKRLPQRVPLFRDHPQLTAFNNPREIAKILKMKTRKRHGAMETRIYNNDVGFN